MKSRLNQRIVDGFANIDDNSATRDHILDYINMLRDTMTTRAHGARRSITFALAGVLLFVLLQNDLTAKLSLGPLEFLKGSPLSVFLPAAVAYFFLDALTRAAQVELLFSAFSYAFKKWNEKAYDNDLETLLTPDMPIYFSYGMYVPTTKNMSEHDKAFRATSVILLAFVLLTPIVFQVYSYWNLFSTFEGSAFIVWLSLGIAVTLTVLAYWTLGSDRDRTDAT